MKKALIIGLILALALIVVGGVGTVYAGVRGINPEVVLSRVVAPRSDGIIRQFVGPGGMMGQYTDGSCPGAQAGGFGPGGMMGGFSCEYGYGPGGLAGESGFQRGPGMMGGRGFSGGEGYGPGMMYGRGEGPMHEYMISAFAESIGLSAEEVETRHDAGETLFDIAIAEGIADEDLPEFFLQLREAALGAAVADEVITQEQADLMLSHMQSFQGRGFGSGPEGCPMWDEQQEP